LFLALLSTFLETFCRQKIYDNNNYKKPIKIIKKILLSNQIPTASSSESFLLYFLSSPVKNYELEELLYVFFIILLLLLLLLC
jgi:hypothetical protein